MSILVTGGTGALGFHILTSVTRNGEKLYSFSDEQPQPWQKVSDVNYRTGDLLNYKDLASVIKEANPRAIYHLASQSSVGLSYKKPYETLSTNLLGTQNLLEAARQIVPEAKILLLSSSEVYGRSSETLLTTLHKESDRPNPLTSYATSKACMELLGNQFANAYGMHIVMIRPFYFTGPHHSRRFLIPSIASQLVKIKKYGAEPIIYSGLEPSVFISKFYDSEGNETDITPQWEINCDFVDSLSVEYVGNSICISVDNNKLINKSFELSLFADGYERATITVKIKAFM